MHIIIVLSSNVTLQYMFRNDEPRTTWYADADDYPRMLMRDTRIFFYLETNFISSKQRSFADNIIV